MPQAPNPVLRRLRAENFKSLRSVDVELKPLTVIVGENSSGKSTLIDALLLIAQAQRQSPAEATVALNGRLTQLGDVSELRSDGASEDERVLVGASFGLAQAPEPHRQELTIDWSFTLGAPLNALHGAARIERVSVEVSSPVRRVAIEVNESTGQAAHDDLAAYRVARGLDVARGPSHLPSFNGLATLGTADGRELRQPVRGVRFRGAFPTGALVESSDIAEVLSRLIRERAETTTLRLRAISTAPDESTTEYPSRRSPDQRSFSAEEIDETLEFCRRSLTDVRTRVDATRATDDIRERLRDADDRTIRTCIETALRSAAQRRLLVPATGEWVDELRGAGTAVTSLLERHLSYLSASRQDPSKLAKSAPSGSPSDVGSHGEHLASVLHAYGQTQVEACPAAPGVAPPSSSALSAAVNYWARWLGIVEEVSVLDHGAPGAELRVKPRQLQHEIDLANVGAGVGSLLPVLVTCLLATPGAIVLLAEPELHLHPAVQQRLADFFLACARTGRQLIVETHSEPLVTRLRRRVAEGDADETLQLVGLLFTELHHGETQLEPVALNSYGGLNSWPEGFFDGQIDDIETIVAEGAAKLAADTAA